MFKPIPDGLPEMFVKVWNKYNEGWLHISEVERINWGWCYQFAAILKGIHGDQCKLWHNPPMHAWIEINGIFYDTENLCGADDSGLCSRVSGWEITIKELDETWRWSGGSGAIRWDIVKETVSLYIASVPIQDEKKENLIDKAKAIFEMKEAA